MTSKVFELLSSNCAQIVGIFNAVLIWFFKFNFFNLVGDIMGNTIHIVMSKIL